MEIYQSQYYRINYTMLKFLGLWHYEDAFINKTKRITIIILIFSIIIPQIIRLFEEWGVDLEIVIEVIASLLYFCGSIIKYVFYLHSEPKLKFLVDEIAKNWKELASEGERKILENYALSGRIMVLIYLIPINIILFIYISIPLVPVLIDLLNPLNETKPKAFPYYAEYFIDDQKYYFELTVHAWIICITSVQIYGTFDSMYYQLVQSSCTLFAIVEFADIINECFSPGFIFLVTLNTGAVALSAVDAMVNFENGNFKQAIRIGMIYIGFSFHYLYNMIPGQKLIDSSSHVRQAAYDSDWFNIPKKSQQLVKIVMLRSLKPCEITAYGFTVLNLENFGFVFKQSMYYVTVLYSVK